MRFLRCLDCGGTLRPRAHPQNRNAKAKSKSQMQRVSRSCFCPGRRGDESQIHRECCKPAAPMSRYHRKWPNAGSGHGDGATSKAEARHDSPIGAAAASRRHKRHSGKARWPSFRATHAPLPSGGGTLTPLIAGPGALARSRSWVRAPASPGWHGRSPEMRPMQSRVWTVPSSAPQAGAAGSLPAARRLIARSSEVRPISRWQRGGRSASRRPRSP